VSSRGCDRKEHVLVQVEHGVSGRRARKRAAFGRGAVRGGGGKGSSVTIVSHAEQQQEHVGCDFCTCVYHRGTGRDVPAEHEQSSRIFGSELAEVLLKRGLLRRRRKVLERETNMLTHGLCVRVEGTGSLCICVSTTAATHPPLHPPSASQFKSHAPARDEAIEGRQSGSPRQECVQCPPYCAHCHPR
jgi:hypothetical protein